MASATTPSLGDGANDRLLATAQQIVKSLNTPKEVHEDMLLVFSSFDNRLLVSLISSTAIIPSLLWVKMTLTASKLLKKSSFSGMGLVFLDFKDSMTNMYRNSKNKRKFKINYNN
ncbi:hypothetical protein QN277_004147 [Acacia crassicarpa]|uniref:Uncharacterized protein n=1 Tax=Acacia crassicarpa TaxID=499986 RepID=A0AAE1MDB6_9FABA|nr:hypothetical protein QN277_004147 [Acacia crassicarpa]